MADEAVLPHDPDDCFVEPKVKVFVEELNVPKLATADPPNDKSLAMVMAAGKVTVLVPFKIRL